MNRIEVKRLTAALTDSGAATLLNKLVRLDKTGVFESRTEVDTTTSVRANQLVYMGALCISQSDFDDTDDIGSQVQLKQTDMVQGAKTLASITYSPKTSVLQGDEIYAMFEDTWTEDQIRSVIDIEWVKNFTDGDDAGWYFVKGRSKVTEDPGDSYTIGSVLGSELNYAIFRVDNLAPLPKTSCA